MEGNLRLKIGWASLIVGSKFNVFALFYFVFEGNFPSSPRGAYIWRGDLTERVFLRCRFGGAYIWRGLYTEGLIFGILRYLILGGNPGGLKAAENRQPTGQNAAERGQKSKQITTTDLKFHT